MSAPAGLERLLNPRTICVVGASEKEGFGGDTCRNVLAGMEKGRYWFVNPGRPSVFGVPCHKSVSDLPGPVDLAVICTPLPSVEGLLREAALKGARAAVVYASGYSEVGTPEGEEAERSLARLCSELGIALMGPNCGGFVNYAGGVHAFAFISDERDRKGAIGVVSQSGQIALSLMDSPGARFSYAVSAGNCAVVRMEDYLDFLVDDDSTKVVAMYLEGLKEPAKFAAALRKAALKRKPVVVLKVGRSAKGAKLAASHTGSLAGEDRVFDALFRKFGVVRVDDIEELLAASVMFATLRGLPAKPTFASMNLSGGETGVCTDAGHLAGLEFPDFSPETAAGLKAILPSYATVNNPLDMTASLSYDSERFAGVLRTVMADEGVGAVAVGYTLLEKIADPAIRYMAKGMELVAAEPEAKPMVMVPFVENTRNPEFARRLEDAGVPVLPPTLYAFKALKHLADFAAYDPSSKDLSLALPEGPAPGKARALSEHESKLLLKAYRVPVPEEQVAKSGDEAARIARRLGYPVVLKVDSADIPHKSDIGGVRVDLQSEEDVRRAFDEILANARVMCPEAAVGGVLVQQMAPPGVEVIVGATVDPQFGPAVLCGLGGVFVEVFKDTVLCLAPLTKDEALGMIRSLRSVQLLKGYRGQPPLDLEALAGLIVSVGAFACAHKDDLKEADLNPVFLYEKGLCAVDALVVKAERG